MEHQKDISNNDQTGNSEIDLLIVAYLKGDIGPDDLERLSQWMSENKAHAEHVNEVKAAWILSGAGRKPDGSDASWAELSHKIAGKTEAPVRRLSWRSAIRVAASFLVVFALGALAMHLFDRQNIPDQIATAQSTETVIEAPLGSISKVTLPDSSQVWLNAGSTIRYSNDFGHVGRQLELTGEAYFSVKTNPQKPFLVKADHVTVRALGTKFNVKAYPEDSSVSATLEEGIIDVNIDNVKHEEIVLKPKEKVVIQKQVNEISMVRANEEQKKEIPFKEEIEVTPQLQDIKIITNINPSLSTSWKDRYWQVDNESVAFFVPMLARRYNQHIVIRDHDLNQYKFTGTIANESIEHILEALRQTAPLNYKIYKDSVVLTMNHANKAKFEPILRNKK